MAGMLFALFGLQLGSFLNLSIDRLPRRESILSGRSRCDACGHTLGPLDLIPLVSYLMLRGRCRYCDARIPIRSALVELGTALLFGLIWMRFRGSLETVFVAQYAALLIIILVIDLEHRKILNAVSYPAIGLALLVAPFAPGREPLEMVLGGALGFGLLLLIALIYPAGMGMGDVKLAAFIGLALGHPQVLLAVFLAFIFGGLISGVLVLARVIGRRDPIAFGPFLAAGALTVMLYGEQIMDLWAAGI